MSSVRLLERVTLADGLGLQLSAKADGARLLAVDKRRPASTSNGSLRKLCISVCSGCAIGCIYCFTNARRAFRQLSTEEIIDQVKMLEEMSPNIKTSDFDETKITFKEMGDPLLNPENVLAAIDCLTKINPQFHFIVSTAGPKSNLWFYEALASRLKNSRIRLCFSCHTTSRPERLHLSPKMDMLTFEEIADLVQQWPGQPVTLNFIIIDGFTYDISRLTTLFDPTRVFIKINYFDNNSFVRDAGLRDASPESVVKFKTELLENGFHFADRLRPQIT